MNYLIYGIYRAMSRVLLGLLVAGGIVAVAASFWLGAR
jgi:hypothetical protein